MSLSGRVGIALAGSAALLAAMIAGFIYAINTLRFEPHQYETDPSGFGVTVGFVGIAVIVVAVLSWYWISNWLLRWAGRAS